MSSPLEGLRVVELGHIMAGPVCGLMLADMGADVVKVERVPDGDPTRTYLPPDIDGEPAAFMILNRNKRGIAVDLKTDAGRDVVIDLLRRADVVIENFRRGTMERLGLGHDTLAEINPRLVYCEISGFGRTGPLADLGGFDLIAQGFSGLMSITGAEDSDEPVKCGAPLTDITAGILAALGVVAACWERERTGRGRVVDTSLFEAGITQTFWQSAITLATGISPGPLGSAHPLSAPYEAFRTADGWLTLGASNQASWLRLVEVLGKPELASDDRYRTNRDRMEHRDSLSASLAREFRHHSTTVWLERLGRAGVPAGPVLSVGEMLKHPQTEARQMVTEVEHKRLGWIKTMGSPVKFDRTPSPIRRAAPILGEHTREVLRELGRSESDIDRLVASGAVTAGSRSG